MGKHHTGPALPSEHVEERGLGRWQPFAQQIGVEQRAVEGHETRVAADRQMQRGDVAIADEWLGVLAQQLEIDAIEQPRGTVSAAQANDRIDLGIHERGMQVIESHLVAAGQVAVLLEHPGKNPQRITASSHPGDGLLGVQRRRTCRRDNSDQPLHRQGRYRRVGNERRVRSCVHPWISLRESIKHTLVRNADKQKRIKHLAVAGKD
ncbi:hypothetical protein D3C84_755600 [compost metagenome]